MALKFDNKLFFHIPKTGGSYVRYVIRKRLPVKSEEVGIVIDSWQRQTHCRPFEVEPDILKQCETFCTIRHPIEWYRSHYRYRIKTSWRNDFPLDVLCVSDTFQGFIKNVIKKWPGYVTELYDNYAPHCDYILRQENLTPQLNKLLRIWGYDVMAPEVLVNDTERDIDTGLTQPLRNKLLRAERKAIERYYS